MITTHSTLVDATRLASPRPFDTKSILRKTISFEDALARQTEQRAKTEVLFASFERIRFCSLRGKLCLSFSDDRKLFPDEHVVKQLGSILRTGSQYPISLLRRGESGDADAVAYAMEHGLKFVDARRRYRFRIQDGERLRAVLSESYSSIRNEWYIKVLRFAVPDGRLLHWRGDCFTLLGSVLVPDTIRAESDSAYGAMVSVVNCEIGKYSLRQQPSLYRDICTNGCVFGQRCGVAFRQHHRGNIDFGELEKEIVANIRDQIPIATQRIQQLLGTRSMRYEGNVKPVVAQLSKDFKLNRNVASSVLRAVHKERQQAPEHRNTLFEIVNAVTRAAQSQDNDTWMNLDELGGRLTQLDTSRWSDLTSRAARLPMSTVDKSFACWSMEGSKA